MEEGFFMENSFGKKNDMTAEIRKAVEDFFERDEVKHEPFDERNVARAVYGVESKKASAKVGAFFRTF